MLQQDFAAQKDQHHPAEQLRLRLEALAEYIAHLHANGGDDQGAHTDEGDGGEKVHLTFEQTDFGPDPAPLMAELARRGWSPTIICESAGTQDVDALAMKELYQNALEGR